MLCGTSPGGVTAVRRDLSSELNGTPLKATRPALIPRRAAHSSPSTPLIHSSSPADGHDRADGHAGSIHAPRPRSFGTIPDAGTSASGSAGSARRTTVGGGPTPMCPATLIRGFPLPPRSGTPAEAPVDAHAASFAEVRAVEAL